MTTSIHCMDTKAYPAGHIEGITPGENSRHVSVENEIVINKPIGDVYQWVVFVPLEIQLPGTKDIPGVISTKMLNDIPIGTGGHRRLVCLADGNTAVEEHIFIDTASDDVSKRYFSYKVWDYSLKIARNIEYGKGEWWFTPLGGATHIRWRYSFKLNPEKILGRLGLIGRALFNIFFIKSKYNDFMIQTLDKLKRDLESTAR